MALRHLYAIFCYVMRSIALEEGCATGSVNSDGVCSEGPPRSLLQHRYQTAGNVVLDNLENSTDTLEQNCVGGVWSAGRCWILSETGKSCNNACRKNGLEYSYARPTEDITPLLIGHTPSGVQAPWLFVECYVAKEDRYHRMNPNAWGSPGKTPASDLAKVGKYNYKTCRLTCPCAAVEPTQPQPVSPSPVPNFAPSPVVEGCSGTFKGGRCWFLSNTGDNCDNTCQAHGCGYSFAVPPSGDMTPELVGHDFNRKQAPWLFVECYVPREDRYHPYSPTAWGVPGKTPSEDLNKSGQYSYDTCQLACPCEGTCSGVPITPAPVPLPVPVPVPVPAPMPTPVPVLSRGRCEAGVVSNDRCWYLSAEGDSCGQTCAAHGCGYSYAAPPPEDIMPQLVGHVPAGKQNPWLFVECYVASEDRYHPYNPNAWGVPGKTPPGNASQPEDFSYETCRLACPCQGECLFTVGTPQPTAAPAPIPAPVPVPVPAPVPTCQDGIGLLSQQRCWYQSEMGANCDDTCALYGSAYMYAAPPADDMVPRLVGHEPSGKQDAWLFLECYVPKEDRYHPANTNAWGVPSKTPADEIGKAGQYSYDTCKLSCPCAGAKPILPVPAPQPVPAAPTPAPYTPPAYDSCSGLESAGRCWYLSSTNGSCDETCRAHGSGCQYSYAKTLEDVTPILVGHQPTGRQNPWLFAECYVAQEDRYHPANPNAWGTPEKTPVADVAKVGQYRYETCQLTCPCSGTCRGAVPPPPPVGKPVPVPVPAPMPVPVPLPVPSPQLDPLPAPVPAPAPPPRGGWDGLASGNGMQAEGRTWYLSETGGNCQDTCAAQGLVFSWAAPASRDSVITPRLLGFEPSVRQGPWAFVECYVPEDNRYHEINRNAWGVPHKTLASEAKKAALWSHAECALACPCAPAQSQGQGQCRWEQPPACAPEYEWKGRTYRGCATDDHDKPWCLHHAQHDWNEEDGLQDWSDCIYTCADNKEDLTPPSNCAWKAPSACVKEFNYEGALTMGCTAADHHSPWCSNTGIYSGSWTHCTYTCENPTAADLQAIAELNKWAESEDTVCSWEAPDACKATFTYKETEYSGCAFFVDSPTPWCSHDSVHNGKWSACQQVCSKVS
jgi:hypothetical protein